MISRAPDHRISCNSLSPLDLLGNSENGSEVIDIQWPLRAKQRLINSESVGGCPERETVPDK